MDQTIKTSGISSLVQTMPRKELCMVWGFSECLPTLYGTCLLAHCGQGRRDDLGGGGRIPFEVDSFHATSIGIMLNTEKFAGNRSPRPCRWGRPELKQVAIQRGVLFPATILRILYSQFAKNSLPKVTGGHDGIALNDVGVTSYSADVMGQELCSLGTKVIQNRRKPKGNSYALAFECSLHSGD